MVNCTTTHFSPQISSFQELLCQQGGILLWCCRQCLTNNWLQNNDNNNNNNDNYDTKTKVDGKEKSITYPPTILSHKRTPPKHKWLRHLKWVLLVICNHNLVFNLFVRCCLRQHKTTFTHKPLLYASESRSINIEVTVANKTHKTSQEYILGGKPGFSSCNAYENCKEWL